MDKRKIEFVAETKIGRDVYEVEDRKSFPKAEADQYIKLGWAKCCETDEQGELVPGVQKLDVHNVASTQG